MKSNHRVPGEKDAIFLFAGEDFGPNNEIVKALVAIRKGVEQADKILEISWDRIQTVVKDPKEAPTIAAEVLKDTGEVVVEIMDDTFEEGKRFFRRIFKW